MSISHKKCWMDRDHIVGDFINIKSFRHVEKSGIRERAEAFIYASDVLSMLDVGCNTGIMGYRAIQCGYNGSYLGVDSNPKAIDIGRKIVVGDNVNFLIGDIEEGLDLPNQSFELVYSKDVIEHLPHYNRAIKEMTRLASKYVLISFFIILSEKGEEDNIRKHKSGCYVNCYNKNSFCVYMKKNKFELLSSFKHHGNELLIFKRVENEI